MLSKPTCLVITTPATGRRPSALCPGATNGKSSPPSDLLSDRSSLPLSWQGSRYVCRSVELATLRCQLAADGCSLNCPKVGCSVADNCLGKTARWQMSIVTLTCSLAPSMVAVVRWLLPGGSCWLTVTWWQLFVDSYMVADVRWQFPGDSCSLTVSYMVAVVGWQLHGGSCWLTVSYMVAVVGWQSVTWWQLLVDS